MSVMMMRYCSFPRLKGLRTVEYCSVGCYCDLGSKRIYFTDIQCHRMEFIESDVFSHVRK